MKRVVTVVLVLMLGVSLSVFGGWKFVKNFPDDSFKPAGSSGGHGVAVDPEGKIWIQMYGTTDSILTAAGTYGKTRVIYCFYPDGSPAPWNGKKVLTLPDGKLDTLWNSHRGLGKDPQGNILWSSFDVIYRLDYKTGEVLQKLQPKVNTTVCAPVTDAEGNVYVSFVLPGNPIMEFDADGNYLGNVTDSEGAYGRALWVTADGLTVYSPRFSAHAVMRYSRPDKFSAFSAPDTVLKGVDSESNWAVNPRTGRVWLDAGTYFDMPNRYPGVVTHYTPGSYYEFDLATEAVTDSLRWNFNKPGNPDERLRGIDFSVTGDTAYVTCFGASDYPPVQMFVRESDQPSFKELVIAEEVKLNGEVPSGLRFKPGRILDNGKTIWFCAENPSTKVSYVFRSIDGGATFTHNATPIEGRAAQMDAFDKNSALIATAEGKIFATDDGGANWTECYSYTIPPLAPGFFDGIRVLGPDVAVAFGDTETDGLMHFVRTENRGLTWEEIQGIDFLHAAYGYYTWGSGAASVGQAMFCAATTTAYDSSFVFRSLDGGKTWESFRISKDIITTYPRSIGFCNTKEGMIAARGGAVVKTSDGGATWSPTNLPYEGAYINGVVGIPNTNIMLGMDDNGVFFTTDLGATWGKITTPETVTKAYIGGVFLNSEFGYVFTNTGGPVLRFKDQVTKVATRQKDNMPDRFQLAQNYPNPFNPTTTIDYTLQNVEKVSLKVFNLRGEEIKTLVDGQMSAGNHSIKWDATDNDGRKVSSGIYLYVLKVGDQQASRKMMLVK